MKNPLMSMAVVPILLMYVPFAIVGGLDPQSWHPETKIFSVMVYFMSLVVVALFAYLDPPVGDNL